jgi:hypothetical protein
LRNNPRQAVDQVRNPPPCISHRSSSERRAISAEPSWWTGMRRVAGLDMDEFFVRPAF